MRLRKLVCAVALVCVPVTTLAVGSADAVVTDPTTVQVIDRASEAGLNVGPTPTWDACVGDWDGNGLNDVSITRHMLYEGALFTQDGSGAFNRQLAGVIMPKVVRKTAPKHTGVDRHACTTADFDHNNLMDMYTTAGRYASNRVKHSEIDNELWMQTAPGVVEDWALKPNVMVNEPCLRSRYALASDWDGDGWADLFVGAQKERADSTDACNTMADYPYIEQSHVYINLGDPEGDGVWNGFRTAPDFNVSAANIGSAMAVEWDYNHDNKPDLLSLNFSNRRPVLLRNTGSSFTTVAFSGSNRLPYVNNVRIGDVTGDGIDDFVYADNTGFAYRAGTATGISSVVVRIGSVPSTADGSQLALGDADGNGTIDVYGQTFAASGTSGNPDDILYLNNGGVDGFTSLPVPPAVGASNDVEAITVNGLTQFVVLNGGHEESEISGPVQLITVSNAGGS